MSKKCVIYYSTVVDAGRWARAGHHQIEPTLPLPNREDPKGKQPEFCCATLENEMSNFNFSFRDSFDKNPMSLHMRTTYGVPGFLYCPFCGAKSTFKENLKLKVVETTVPCKTYSFQEV